MPENIIERAFQLARSGQCRSMADIHQQLRREGFIQIQEHLSGRLIKSQLTRLINDAAPQRLSGS